jgi:hypothetical protein
LPVHWFLEAISGLRSQYDLAVDRVVGRLWLSEPMPRYFVDHRLIVDRIMAPPGFIGPVAPMDRSAL